MDLINGDSLRGHLELMVLAVLEGGEAHGFELIRRLKDAGSGALQLKEGSLYPALYRLEEAGMLRSKWDNDVSNGRGPRRRIYQLTRKGSRRLGEGRVHWQHFVQVIGSILGVPA